MNALQVATVVLKRLRIGSVAPDPDDAYLIEMAIVSGADFLVTGDKALLAMRHVVTTSVVSARRFAAMLAR